MNVLTIFDQRVSAIFEQRYPDQKRPLSFKRLAKRAIREMEDETFVIDGIDTAPALYTILISPTEDQMMRPLYVDITEEISQLIEAQAKKRGYTFVGKPLVRFMVDPSLRRGKFAVFAENIDPRTLARLRDEENAYLGISQAQPSFEEQVREAEAFAEPSDAFEAAPTPEPAAQPVAEGEAVQVEAEPTQEEQGESPDEDDAFAPEFDDAFADDNLAGETDDEADGGVDGLDIQLDEPDAEEVSAPATEDVPFAEPDFDFDLDDPEPEPAAEPAFDLDLELQAELDEPEPEPQVSAEDLLEAEVDAILADLDPHRAEEGAVPDFLTEPADNDVVEPQAPAPRQAEATDFVEAESATDSAPYADEQAHFAPEPVEEALPSCTLTDLASGAVYRIADTNVPIGRERLPHGLVLSDPNVSRRHAVLTYDESSWRIRDLQSTNGTLVNNIDVPYAILRDGDVLTIGLTELEFRAS